MPAGLDGHPDPIRSPERDAVLHAVADAVRDGRGRRLVGIDGRSGSGKSTFGDELAACLRAGGAHVVRSTIDSFHRPRAERLRDGPTSAVGYYRDSHRLDRMVGELLEPFRAGAAQVLVSAFDEPSDSAREVLVDVPPDAVLVVDGLFLHRPELVSAWDVSVLVAADARRDQAWLDYLLGDLPVGAVEQAAEIDRRLDRARWPRYRDGWRAYVETVDPAGRATFVVDNDDLARPRVLVDRRDERAASPQTTPPAD